VIIHWFRRDLRLHDNTALLDAAARSGGRVLPLFIFDQRVYRGRFASPNRTQWLLDSLAALRTALRTLGSDLLIRHGRPEAVLPQLLEQSGASGVVWNRDYTPFAVARDSELKADLRTAGFHADSRKDLVLVEFHELLTGAGKPYTVFTPYARRWRERLAAEPPQLGGLPQLQPLPELPRGDLPLLGELLPGAAAVARPAAGEAAAHRLLTGFLAAPLAAYAAGRDQLAAAGTSRLSPYLRLGVISPRQVYLPAAAHGGDGAASWINELAWREFYVQVTAHQPHVSRGAFKPAFDAIVWPNDAELFAAWCAGRTGYPLVDAAMRQLLQEGWMHNRARMVTASFLTKDLLVDWRLGEAYFMQQLFDGDPAANNGGWQWAAGTGTDAQPYFRIFNPVSQGKKFDPEGAYVRRYVPELAQVPTRFIHEPWLLSPADQIRCGVRIGRDYPAPIVDHAVQRQRALDLYGAVRSTGE
jgi:deoxyribodipyrimidine photo-lyase